MMVSEFQHKKLLPPSYHNYNLWDVHTYIKEMMQKVIFKGDLLPVEHSVRDNRRHGSILILGVK